MQFAAIFAAMRLNPCIAMILSGVPAVLVPLTGDTSICGAATGKTAASPIFRSVYRMLKLKKLIQLDDWYTRYRRSCALEQIIKTNLMNKRTNINSEQSDATKNGVTVILSGF